MTFVLAAAGITTIAPYTSDPTWDYVDAAFMSVLAFATAYLLFRDGFYPVTWWANLVASSVLYLTAGLFWSLAWSPVAGGMFAFTQEGWPYAPVTTTVAFRRIVWPALWFMLVVGIMILFFATGWR